MNDRPTLSTFDPTIIKWQDDVIDYLHNVDWELGMQEILLSGSLGSAKTTLAAHLAIKHCMSYRGANVLIGRRALPDLKRTLYDKIIEHLDQKNIKVGRDYCPVDSVASIYFPKTKSQIIAGSWADKKYKKFRSLDLSMAIIEELTENVGDDQEAYEEISMRVGRIGSIPEKILLSLTNPDGTSHWAYKKLIIGESETKKVFYSVTEDNPFLPKNYIARQKQNLDPKMAERMLYGRWVDIAAEIIYYQYTREKNFVKEKYIVDTLFPIHLCWDFNIALGKPMSACVFQIKNGIIHVFKEFIVHGSDTESLCEEIVECGLLEYETVFYIHGDATGRAGSSKSKYSDYDIIQKYFARHRTKLGLKVESHLEVPLANPPIRERHNLVNAYCLNADHKVRLLVYQDCKVLDEGLRLTALKKGGSFIEDDSKEYQHVTTALGYGIWWVNRQIKAVPSVTRSQIR